MPFICMSSKERKNHIESITIKGGSTDGRNEAQEDHEKGVGKVKERRTKAELKELILGVGEAEDSVQTSAASKHHVRAGLEWSPDSSLSNTDRQARIQGGQGGHALPRAPKSEVPIFT